MKNIYCGLVSKADNPPCLIMMLQDMWAVGFSATWSFLIVQNSGGHVLRQSSKIFLLRLYWSFFLHVLDAQDSDNAINKCRICFLLSSAIVFFTSFFCPLSFVDCRLSLVVCCLSYVVYCRLSLTCPAYNAYTRPSYPPVLPSFAMPLYSGITSSALRTFFFSIFNAFCHFLGLGIFLWLLENSNFTAKLL